MSTGPSFAGLVSDKSSDEVVEMDIGIVEELSIGGKFFLDSYQSGTDVAIDLALKW